MTPRPRPPRLARLMVSLLLTGEMREVVLGDLDEEFAHAVATGSNRRLARRRYWRQALASIAARGRDLGGDGRPPDRRSHWMSARSRVFAGVSGDLRHAARVLAHSPGFTAVAVLSLAIGIGANTAVYALVRSLLLVPLAVDAPDELKLVYWLAPPKTPVRLAQINSSHWQDPDTGRNYASNLTWPMFTAIRDAAGSSTPLFAFNFMRHATVSIGARPPVVAGGLLASGSYFSTMRVEFAAGRPFGEADDRPGANAVAVVSHDFWTRTLDADPRAVGRTIRVNGTPVEVIGVTARGYRGLSQGGFFPAVEITVPIAHQPLVMPQWNAMPAAGPSMFTSNLAWVRAMGRLPAPAPEQAQALDAALRASYARLPGAERADLSAAHVRLLPGRRGLDALRTDVERPLQLLAGVTGIVLILACLNLAGLLLARGVARQRELAVRRALGAGRARLVRVLLLDSLLLAGLGGALGVVLAMWASPLVSSMLTTGLGAAGVSPSLDWTLVATAAAISLVAALIAGVVPAVRLSGRRAALLTQRGDASGARGVTGRTLIALQIAASVPLLVGAGLLLRTVANLSAADLGFDPRGVVVFRIDPRLDPGVGDDNPLPLYDRIVERVRSMPGVTAAALVENVLVSGRTSNTDVWLDGTEIDIFMNAVGPDFFETMALPIVAGRGIEPRDRQGAPAVAVINETAAAKYFPGQSPIGRRLTVGKRELEIVGVAGTTLYRNLRTPPVPTFYDAYAQRSLDNIPALAIFFRHGAPSPMHVVVRTMASPAAIVAAIPEAVRDVAPGLPITDLKTHLEQIDETIGRERMFTRLLVLFGGFAVLLACVGLYGVTAYAVARRTSEIGIRVALGAQRGQVVWLMLRQVLLVALIGIAVGVPLAIAAGPLVASLLFGLAPRDALTIAVASAAILAVALAAGWIPARRAARLPVVAALRRD